MPYTIDVQKKKGYVHLSHTGKVGVMELEKSRKDVFSHLTENNLNKVLGDITKVTKIPTILSLIQFIFGFNRLLPKGYKAALLYDPESELTLPSIDEIQKKQNVNLKAFSDKKEALKWLLK